MITSELNKKAWQIRKQAAAKFNCPVMEIVWGECLRMAKAGKENNMRIETQTKTNVPVALETEGYKIKVTAQHPQLGEIVGYGEWGEVKGNEGIVLGGIKIDNKYQIICVQIPKDDWDKIAEARDAKKAEDVETAMNMKAIAFIHKIGCDASDRWDFEYEDKGLPFDAKYKRIEADQRGIIKAIKKLNIKDLAEKFGAEEVGSDGMSYGGWKFEGTALDALLEEAEKEKAKIKAEKEKEKKEAEQERTAMEEARKEFDMEILKIDRREGGEGENDPYAKVKLTDSKTGETIVLHARNIFDFGFVINPEGGGIPVTNDEGEWYWDKYVRGEGWGKKMVRMTNTEIRGVAYLRKFSPITTRIRM